MRRRGRRGLALSYSIRVSEWESWRDVSGLTADDFMIPGEVFRVGDHMYRTTGTSVGEGGMGMTFFLDHREPGARRTGRAVAKVFWPEFLVQVDRDPVAHRHFAHTVQVIRRLREISNLHLMPILAAEQIRDNFLQITPYYGKPFSAVIDDAMSPRQRVAVLIQAVRGLRALHDAGIVHCDFTPRNVLIGDPSAHAAVLFDFDLCVDLTVVGERSYHDHYEERIVGAPEYSLPPEIIDPVLLQSPVSPRRDVYAVGTTLYSLFTDASIYGDVPDLPSLLRRISEGVVRHGVCDIDFPADLPEPVRQVIVRCLERDPAQRYRDAAELVVELERVKNRLSADSKSRFRTTLAYAHAARFVRIKDVIDGRPDASVTSREIRDMQVVLQRFGYLLERSLGRVKGHPIYRARPDPTLVLAGRFVGDNPYPKIVTAIDLGQHADSEAFVAEWLGRIKPILDSVRTAPLTVLDRVAVDRPSGKLLLFSECIDDPRFGTDLEGQELTLHEVLGLGLLVVTQVGRLHAHGLAHNNVNLRSLLFKGFADTGEVQPAFVGLVEPSFAPPALAEDVRRLAEMIHGLIHPARIEAVDPASRPALQALVANLAAIAGGEVEVPDINGLIQLLCDGLTLIEGNFGVILAHGGNPLAFADMMVRHSLYRRLWHGAAPAHPEPSP